MAVRDGWELRPAALLPLLLLLAGCASDERACRQDTDCGGDQVCDSTTGICVARTGRLDLGPQDAAPAPDGPWTCGLPAQGGGAVACTYTWSCSDGMRRLSCEYDVVNNVFNCTCHDLKKKTVDGTFKGPSQTCASGADTVKLLANTRCRWKLP